MRHLVISYGKGIARARVKQLAPKLGSHGQQAMFPQLTVHMKHSRDRDNAVFRDKDDTRITRSIMVDQTATYRVQFVQIAYDVLAVGTEPLETVVEVRQVDQGQRRIIAPIYHLRGLCNPAARRYRGTRPPELKKRKLP